MKFKKLWLVKFGLDLSLTDLTPEEKVMINLHQVYVRADTIKEVTDMNFRLRVESIECVGLIVEKFEK